METLQAGPEAAVIASMQGSRCVRLVCPHSVTPAALRMCPSVRMMQVQLAEAQAKIAQLQEEHARSSEQVSMGLTLLPD